MRTRGARRSAVMGGRVEHEDEWQRGGPVVSGGSRERAGMGEWQMGGERRRSIARK